MDEKGEIEWLGVLCFFVCLIDFYIYTYIYNFFFLPICECKIGISLKEFKIVALSGTGRYAPDFLGVRWTWELQVPFLAAVSSLGELPSSLWKESYLWGRYSSASEIRLGFLILILSTLFRSQTWLLLSFFFAEKWRGRRMRGNSTPQCNNFRLGVSLQNRDEGITINEFTTYP